MVLALFASVAHAADPVSPAASPVTWKKIVLADKFYGEGAAFGDFNHDGVQDVTAAGFWWEGPDFKVRHQFADYPATDPHNSTKDFLTFTCSLKNDGWDDIIIITGSGADTSWYENPRGTSDGKWVRHKVFNDTEYEAATMWDLFGNGKPVLVCASEGKDPQGARLGYAQPDYSDPAKAWAWHPISAHSKKFSPPRHGLGVGDVNGDGRNDIVMADGWLEQPASVEGDPEWKFHPAQFFDKGTEEGGGHGNGGAQMFVYDVNGDGRNDVVTSLQSHGYGLAWFEQKPDGSFEKHLIMGSKASDNAQGVVFSQLHGLTVADIDGDGLPDIITGKRWWARGPLLDPEPNATPVLYWFQLVRHSDGKADYVAHQIDDAGGGSTQIGAKDIHNDHHPAIVVANKRGIFLYLQETPGK